jgi:cytochrome b561
MATAIHPTERYSTGAIWFHWIIAVLVIANIVIGLLHETLLRGTLNLHKSIGLTVLVLTIGRILWRLAHRPPPLPHYVAGWQRHAAHGMYWIFYALLLIMPLTGWAMSSGPKRHPLQWFGLFDWPYLPVDAGTADVTHTSHVLLGYLMAVLVVIHIVAALRHHFLLRDAVLTRMAPGLRRRA